ETYAGNSSSYFLNGVIEITVGSSAKVEYCRLQAESNLAFHVWRTQVSLAENSQFSTLNVSVGARLQRHNFSLALKGSGAHANIWGLGVLSGDQHSDSHTLVDHQVGDCTTEQVYKSILNGSSRAVFDGRILIRKNSQKANSSQMNHNLLLSQNAEADSKPQLEIYADDVKATHGSTTGQINNEELFYLQSRGIDKETGVQMLSRGFAYDLIYKVQNEQIRAYVDQIVSEYTGAKM
ncbi:MAG: Fe-S cluster assembly protein SufD, partial [Pseudobdellovibrionaceae bacterium]